MDRETRTAHHREQMRQHNEYLYGPKWIWFAPSQADLYQRDTEVKLYPDAYEKYVPKWQADRQLEKKDEEIELLKSELAAKDAEIERLKNLHVSRKHSCGLTAEQQKYNASKDCEGCVGVFANKHYKALESELAEKDAVLEWYGDESNWRTIKHCESDTLSKIRTDASDYDSYGYSEYGEASRLMMIGGKRAREVIQKYKGAK